MRLKDCDLYHIYQKWIENTGIFRCFFRSTNFVSLKHYPDFKMEEVDTVHCPVYDFIVFVRQNAPEGKALYFLDVPGTAGIQAAYFLQKHKVFKPILTFNNILHPHGLNTDPSYISSLVGYGLLLEPMELEEYIFVLDENRYGDYSEDQLRKYFNNQYEITDEDLPPIEVLRHLGYERLVYIHHREVKEDVGCYLEYLENNGFQVIKEALGGSHE